MGTVPIQRRRDHGGKADNTDAMAKLYEALQGGDMVCVFPEGVSRYQSGLAPLRPGVGRIVLEVTCLVGCCARPVCSCPVCFSGHSSARAGDGLLEILLLCV